MAKMLLTVLALGLASCAQPQNHDDTKVLAKIDELNARIKAQASQLDDLQKRQAQTSNGLYFLKSTVEAQGLAEFDPITSQGYSILDAGVGKLMISVDDIAPYADGVKVRLAVGNPNSVVMNGLSGEVTYGPATSQMDSLGFEAWQAKQKTVPVNLPDSLSPGHWNKVTITLPGVGTTGLGRLILTLKGNQIQMLR